MTWSIPDSPNGIITRYTLYVDYKNGTTGSTRGIVGYLLDPSITSYVITGLTPYQLVGVFLSASTSIGMGPNSTMADVRTEQTGD